MSKVVFIPTEKAKDRKAREAREEKGGHSSTLEERQLRTTGASIMVTRPKHYSAQGTLDMILGASSEQRSKKEAYQKLCNVKFDPVIVQEYISATLDEEKGLMIPLTITETKKYKTANEIKGRGLCFLVYKKE